MSSFRQLMMRKKEEPLEIKYLTKQGSVSVTDGIASNFTISNFLYFQDKLNTPFEFKMRVKVTQSLVYQQMNTVIGWGGTSGVLAVGPRYWNVEGFTMMLSENSYSWTIADIDGSTPIPIGDFFWFKLSFTGSQYKLEISTNDGVSFVTDMAKNSSSYIYSGSLFNICFGRSGNNWVFQNGEIDFNRSRFTKDGVEYKFEILS